MLSAQPRRVGSMPTVAFANTRMDTRSQGVSRRFCGAADIRRKRPAGCLTAPPSAPRMTGRRHAGGRGRRFGNERGRGSGKGAAFIASTGLSAPSCRRMDAQPPRHESMALGPVTPVTAPASAKSERRVACRAKAPPIVWRGGYLVGTRNPPTGQRQSVPHANPDRPDSAIMPPGADAPLRAPDKMRCPTEARRPKRTSECGAARHLRMRCCEPTGHYPAHARAGKRRRGYRALTWTG